MHVFCMSSCYETLIIASRSSSNLRRRCVSTSPFNQPQRLDILYECFHIYFVIALSAEYLYIYIYTCPVITYAYTYYTMPIYIYIYIYTSLLCFLFCVYGYEYIRMGGLVQDRHKGHHKAGHIYIYTHYTVAKGP